MSLLQRPTIAAERWLALGASYRALRDSALRQNEVTGWRTATLLTRVLFFALGIAAAMTTLGIFALLNPPFWIFLAGIALLAAAEWLIAARRLFASGIEEALWTAGSLAALVGLIEPLNFGHDAPPAFAVAVGLAVAAWRLLNPLLSALSALAFSVAIALQQDIWQGRGVLIPAIFCFALGLLALWFAAYQYRRPAHDRALGWLMVAMPAAGYFWTLWGNSGSTIKAVAVLGPLLFGSVAFVLGIARRQHAAIIAALVCVVLLAVELRHVTGLPLHWRLILWGIVALLLSTVLERWLRKPRSGITSLDVEDPSAAIDLLQIGGASIATASATPDVQPGFSGQGGQFGGGGASGKF
jgi:hypothetical protein